MNYTRDLGLAQMFDCRVSPSPSLKNLRWSVILTVSFSLSRNQINMLH